jgi:hypothetical protein
MATQSPVPWMLHPLDPWIGAELERRAKEYDITNVGGVTEYTNQYSGPRTAWTRVFSNGISKLARNREGFIMGGTEGFDESYGFKDSKITIGVDAYGNLHEIDAIATDIQGTQYDFPHRPPPSVTSIECEFEGAGNVAPSGRKVKINWKCYSLNQLNYLIPYFLTGRVSVLVEWGWNNYNKDSLIDLTDINELKRIFTAQRSAAMDRIQKSNGNYDYCIGMVSDYGYSMNEVGGYDCYTVIQNPSNVIQGQAIQTTTVTAADPTSRKESVQLKDLVEFTFEDLDGIVRVKRQNSTGPDAAGYRPLGGSNFAPQNQNTFEGVKRIIDARDENIKNSYDISTVDRIFRTGGNGGHANANQDDAVFMRMDLVADIINKFFAIQFVNGDGESIKVLDDDGTSSGVQCASFVINGVAMCANPLLKSVNRNIIFPNKYAPRLVSVGGQGGNTLSSIDAPEYKTLFQTYIQSTLQVNELSEEYDDLQSVVNRFGNSFPMYEKYNDDKPLPGYWGYLSDVFVSVKLFKELIKNNDTIKRLIDDLLQRISSATCDISRLRITLPDYQNQYYSVRDTNFTPISTPEAAGELFKINLNSVGSSYVRSVDFSQKLAPEMFGKLIHTNATNTPLPPDKSTATYDANTVSYSENYLGDRLFYQGAQNGKSKKSSNDDSITKNKRLFDKDNSQFYIFEVPGRFINTNAAFAVVQPIAADSKYYILSEENGSFLKSLLYDKTNKNAIYTNNTPLPGISMKIDFLGIGGITYLSQFTMTHVPEIYNYKNSVWEVLTVTQKVENKMWTTSISAAARPLLKVTANRQTNEE